MQHAALLYCEPVMTLRHDVVALFRNCTCSIKADGYRGVPQPESMRAAGRVRGATGLLGVQLVPILPCINLQPTSPPSAIPSLAPSLRNTPPPSTSPIPISTQHTPPPPPPPRHPPPPPPPPHITL